MFDKTMRNRYKSGHDLNKYLRDTIIRYDGMPYYVCSISDHGKLDLHLVGDNNVFKMVFADDPKLDIAAIELGYMNYSSYPNNTNVVIYVKRLPYRRWKQGIDLDGVSFDTIDGQRARIDISLYSKSFRDSIDGNFPTLDDALEILGDAGEIAISQEIALQKRKSGLLLFYFKTEELGYIKEGSKTVYIASPRKAWIVDRYLEEFSWDLNIVGA